MEKLTEMQIESLAEEIREFLIENSLWVDVCIYFNGKVFSTSDGKRFYYNDPDNLVVLENKDPRNCFEYVADPHILSMSFEGDFCGCLNYYNEYGADFDNRIQKEFSDILTKYGLYYELGHHWNLTCFYSKKEPVFGTEEWAKELVEALGEMQDDGSAIGLPCPCCGKDNMKNDLAKNALSRYAKVYVCSQCGLDEALRALTGEVLPFLKWAMPMGFMQEKE